jgi:energy-coupling factor transporter ATP-binding protein EcfA2
MDDNFKKYYNDLVESLKRHQRAELLNEDNENLIEQLYTDPYEGNAVLNAMLNDQTTLLIGRKGSGKSTIINRFQYDIRKTKDKISLYIDVRTIYSRSQNSIEIDNNSALSGEEQVRFSLYSNFIKKIIEEIKNEVNKNLFENNKWKQKILNLFSDDKKISETDFINRLEEILNQSLNSFSDISKLKVINETEKKAQEMTGNISVGVKLSSNPELEGNIVNKEVLQNSNERGFSSILKRDFQIVNFSDKLKKLLNEIGIKKVFICLDDSSELDKDALDVFIKTIVAPLHNDSEGFFRFKIAFYPERYTLPEIDRTKIDTLLLDYYHLYKSSGADKVEEQAISYVKRLLQQRIMYYFQDSDVADIENQLFDTRNLKIDDYYKIIFQICSCIPRNIGKVLFYAQKRSISQGKQITKSILQESAEEQYNNDIETTITRDEFFTYKSYNEIFKRTQLKLLVQKVIEKAKENKKQIGESNSIIFKDYTPSNAPSPFLFVKKGENENYLSTLEINFLITRISEQKDKGDYINKKLITNDIVVYTINYGLCQKENIIFEDVNNRKYRIERVFDYNKLVEEWANNSAYVKCKNCNVEYDISEWEKIKEFDCYCKHCKTPNACELVNQINARQRNETIIEATENQNYNFKNEQLRIIHCLHIESNLTESLIAGELDCSPETVRAYLRSDRKLRTDGYVQKNETENTYSITGKAENEIYNNGTN